jgi:hypothetical protein
MKKIFALLLSAAATIVSAFAQDKPQKGDIIYGTVTDSIGPVAGAIVIERNANDRIMAQTKTDLNGNFSFRLVNPDNEICFMRKKQNLYNNSHGVIMPITGLQYDINMDQISDIDESLAGFSTGLDVVFECIPKPYIDYYFPFRDFIHYNSIEDLFNNMFFYF